MTEAGLYDLHFRFASNSPRPMELVAGATSTSVPFQGSDFSNWILQAPVTVELAAGVNDIALSIPAGAGRGPNIDSLILTSVGAAPDFPPAFDSAVGAVAYAENGTGAVADLGATDFDGSDTVTYAVEGVDAEAFEVDDQGVVTFAATPDFENPADADRDNIYDVAVVATEGDQTSRQDLSVTVTNAVEATTAVTLAARTFDENAAGAVIADIAYDGDARTFAEVTVDDTANFRILEEDGGFVLALADGVFLDAEAASQPSAIVTVAGIASAPFDPEPENLPEGATAITLVGEDVAENEAGAVVAVITVEGETPSFEEFGVSDAATYRVIDDAGVLKLALQPTVFFDFEGAAPPAVTVTLGDLAADAFTPTVLPVDEPPVLSAQTVGVNENDASGAVVASIDVTDPDADASYVAGDFIVDDPRFEVIEQDGFKLALKAGQSLDFEAGAPTVKVTLAGVDLLVTPDVANLAESLSIMFDQGAITPYGTSQDRPSQGGTGATVAGGVGGEITLDGNLWKRAAVDPFTVEQGTVLRVTIDVATVGEAVGIGFDLDNDPFDEDRTVYQIAGPQTVRRFVDVRTPESTNGTGTFTFEIDLSAHAGKTVGSLVLVADDDLSSDGLGKVTFSGVEIVPPADGDGGNADPRVVGGGVADFAIDEGSTVEIDLPFADDDGDALTYDYAVTLNGAPVTDFPLAISDGVLSGALGATAPGVYQITVIATDGKGGQAASDTFALTVENLNEAPVADPNPGFEPYFGKVGQKLATISVADFAGAFSDPDGDQLVLSATGLPAGLVFDPATGLISGTPTEAGDGTFTVVATEAGSGGLSASIEVTLEIDLPSPGEVFIVEAENFTGLGSGSTGFFATGQAGASGDRLIRTNPGTDAAVETVLSQNGVAPGWYTVAIDVYDELDGTAGFTLAVGGVQVSADGATFDDAGAWTDGDGIAGRGNAGQIGNRKTISFDKAVYVEEGTVLSLTGTADGELLRTDRVILTRVDSPNAAPEAVALAGDPVAENADGAAVGVLSAIDPDGEDGAITFAVDPASPFEVVGNELRLKAGESLNFEAGATVSVEVVATDGAGASTKATLTVAVADVDEAPEDLTLTGAAVAENAPGAVVGTLGAADPEDGAITFTVSDPRFVVENATLRLADGVSLDHEEAATVSVEVEASDGVNTATRTFDVAVTDENDAPTLANPALADVATATGAESRTDLSALGASDQDGDTLSYGVRSGTAGALPAGIAVDGTELVVTGDVPAGTYAVEVFATDGLLESESVSLNVTVGAAAPFETIIVQGESFDIASHAAVGDGNPNLIRTETQNWERDGSPLNPEPNTTPINPNDETFTALGLRPGYTGDGYLDINGSDEGTQASFAFDAPAGTYDLTVRYANGSGTQPRPMSFTIGDQTETIADTRTNVDGVANTGWYNWQTATLTFTVTGDGPHTVLVGQSNTQGAPNIDAVAISATGVPVAFVPDTSADEDGNLAAAAPASVAAADLGAVEVTLTGVDSDIVLYEVSVDGGAYAPVTPVAGAGTQVVTLDLSAFAQAGSVSVNLRLTDDANNRITRQVDVAIANEPVEFQPVTIQAEDGTQVTIVDPDTATGFGTPQTTQIIDETNSGAFGDLWPGATGNAYVDLGNNPGDGISISLTVPADGVYTAAIRYANGAAADRPMTISVDGAAQGTVPFAPTPGVGGASGWSSWTEVEVALTLKAGANTILLDIPAGGNNGPNIDEITFAAAEVDPTAPTEPGPRETIRINFQDGAAPKAEGYLVANFDGYQARANGETYGFVTEASVYDADTASNTPIDGARYPSVAINERSGTGENGGLNDGINFDAMDPRLTGYAHTDLPGYPGAQGDPNERVAFELAVANGWYEVTVAVGDTGGPNDSDNKLEIEGRLVSDFVPTNEYKTQLITAQVEVTDGNLTLAAPNGTVTEFQYLDVRALPDLTPDDGNPAPNDYSTVKLPVAASGVGQTFTEVPIVQASGPVLGIDPTAAFTMGLDLAEGRSGVLLSSLNDGSIKVVETLTGEAVDITVNTSGGFDTLTISPIQPLKEFTSYTLIIDGLLDRGAVDDLGAPSREFQKSTFTFTTKELPEIVDREVAFEDTLMYRSNPAAGEVYTSIEISPDGSKLYTASLAGTLTRWDLDPTDGSIVLDSKEVFFPAELNEAGDRRGIIGLVFDPEDSNVIWITDNYPVPLNGRDNGVPEFSGAVSKVTLGDGGSLAGATFETYITGLPRSNGDHVTNSLEFRNTGTEASPDWKLYLIQGSNSAMGEADKAWGFRPERLLNASVMEIDHKRTAPEGGFDVSTEPVPQDGLNRRYEYSDTINNGNTLAPTDDGDLKNGGLLIDDGPFVGNFLHFDARGVATVRTGEDASSAVVEGGEFYDPFADDAVLKIFATGQRNAYDLVWHSNGKLYTPTNGSAAGGNAPDNPDTTGVNEAAFGIERQDDYLFIIEEGSYSGHPNPLRNEFILNGGNPTSGTDPNQVDKYPVGTQPEANYDPANAYSLGPNRSPNGAIEYTSNVFGANLKGAIVFVEYSNDNNLRAILLDENGLPIPEKDFALQRPDGSDIQSSDPLDVIQDAKGRLYVLTLERDSGTSNILRLNPAPGGIVGDVTADAGDPLTLTVLDGTNPAAVLFAVTGLDDDIRSVRVSFDGGTTSEAVLLDPQGRFTRDLSAATGAVTATLIVQDEVPNTATASTVFTTGGASGSTFIDALAFTLLDTDSGSKITRLDDPTTHESPTSGNDVSPKDGLNDGFDGGGYADPSGGAEDKFSFVVNANGAGTYELSFRMASNDGRSVAIKTGDQSVAIDVNTGTFTNWTSFPVTLTLEDGPNTIVIAQTTSAGPNIDSVTVTPIDVAADGTADEGGDLAVTLGDDGDRTATRFDVAGLDADIQTVTVAFNGGPAQAVEVVDGSFTANTSALSGEVTVTLTVRDGALNTATAFTTATFAAVVANDGTALIDGIEYTLYEAENAALGGAVVISEPAVDRNASGDGFVDFDGTTDQTITWTIEVAEGGTYEAAILYALSTAKAARPMTLSVDGVVVDTLPFVPNSTVNEDAWGPQPFALDLAAGVHTITVTAPGANGPNVDQLRITSEPTLMGDPDADIAIRSLDPTYFDDRLHFSWIDNPAVGESSDRDFKENAFVEISNSGTADLVFSSATVSGPFELADPAAFDGLVLAGGQSVTVEVLFDRSAYTSGSNGASGVFKGALTLRTNDAEDRIATVDLAGFWQQQNEGGWEPNINEVWEVFGFGNFIDGLSTNSGGGGSVLDFYDLFLPSDETEAMSPYFRIADGFTEAKITQIASYNGSANAPIRIHAPDNKGTGFQVTNWSGAQNQTLFPLEGDGDFATATFDRGRIPDAWAGDDVFGITMAGLSTDPTLNPSGGGTVSQAELNARYPGYTVTNGTVFDPDGNEVPDGYTVRMFQAVDAAGNAIPNVYLGVMDYTGINYDYNDNMFVIEGVTALGTRGALAVSGLDDAAADDRLVFTNIETPSSKGAFPQTFRNEATFTIENAGNGALTVTDIAISGDGAGTFEIVGGLPSPIAAGGSAQVTVRYAGTDDGSAGATLHEASMTISTSGGAATVALAGLAQDQSENGQEPTAQQIVTALGYDTLIPQAELNGGGVVETIGDEVLMPYLERLDGSKPVEVINLAAFLQQGNVSRLNLHELADDGLTELFAGDDQQGQTILPDGLVAGVGDTGSVARATIARDAPFGLKVTVDGRPTFSAWTDPKANLADDTFDLGPNNEGHYIRFFQAKDASGAAIPGTFIGIQDYPGGENFDYNDAMFLVTNVRPHALTAAEDANGNGVNDALETDADGDGVVAFFDADDSPVVAPAQTAFNGGGTPWAVGDGLTLKAAQYDDGGQGVAYNDDPGLSGGTTGGRPGSDVEVTPLGDVGWINPGEWLEYTITVGQAGTYDLDLLMATNGGAGRSATVTFTAAGASTPYASTGQVANPNTGGWTTFQERSATVDLQAGEQVVRILFEGGSQDIRSFSLTPQQAPTNRAPVADAVADAAVAEGAAISIDLSGAFSDPDDDALSYAVSGLPGLSISASGLLTGTAPQVGADTDYTVIVTASDGSLFSSTSFTLTVEDVAPAAQTPFPGPNAPVVGAGPITIDAGDFDAGGNGIAWNDDPGLNGTQTARADTDVELVGPEQDIGYVLAGEWVEYTVNVAEAGLYDLSVNAKTPIGGNTVTVSIEGGTPLATFALPDSNGASTSFAGTSFGQSPAQQVALEAGLQTIRVAFDGAPASNGYLLDYRGFTLDKVEDVAEPGGPIGEAGKLSLAQTSGTTWTRVDFAQELDNPSVVVGPLTANDGSPATVRVRNVTDTGFEVQIDEWDYLDGVHGAETIQWVALEAGVHEIDGRTVVAGSGTATGNDSALSFGTSALTAAPVVFAQIASANDGAAATAQLNSVSASGFVLDLDRQERDAGIPHGTERVDWIAVQGGGHAGTDSFSGLLKGINHIKGTLNLPVAGRGTDDFVFLADMQSEVGPDAATVRLMNIFSKSWAVRVEEEQSLDAETNHAKENIGYFGILDGLIYDDDTPFV